MAEHLSPQSCSRCNPMDCGFHCHAGMDALAKVIEPLLPLDFEVHESQTIKDAALRDRAALARRIALCVIPPAKSAE